MAEIKEMTGQDTSAHTFFVCGNIRCGEFYGCKNSTGRLRVCTTCGFHQKFSCARIVDILRDEGKDAQIAVWTDSCEFCPPERSETGEGPVAFMSDE